MCFHRSRFIAVVLAALAPLGLSAATEKSHVRATLVADVKSIQPGTPFWAGVRLEMDPGWHIYWVNPGEAGQATKVRWTLPQGLDAGPLLWPEPKRIEANGVVSYGYEGRILLMAKLQTSSDLSVFDPAIVKARVDWMECSGVCVPGGANLSLELPVKIQPLAANESSRDEFSRAQAALPLSDSPWRVSLIDMPAEWRIMFRPPVGVPCLGKQISFYPDRGGLVPPSAPQKWEWVGDGCRLILKKATLTEHQSVFSGLVVRADGWDESGAHHALRVQLPVQ